MRVHPVSSMVAFDPRRHVERVLDVEGSGDVSLACWEPDQISPYHCHPEATEAYFCLVGGGTMRTPDASAAMSPGILVLYPPGELHEYENGPDRSVLLRVRYGRDLVGREFAWRGNPEWRQSPDDRRYFRRRPAPAAAGVRTTT